MSLSVEPFGLYVERRRQEGTWQRQRYHWWALLTCGLGLFPWICFGLGVVRLTIPLAAVASGFIGLCSIVIGTDLLSQARARPNNSSNGGMAPKRRLASLPRWAIELGLGVGLVLWGEFAFAAGDRRLPLQAVTLGSLAGALAVLYAGSHYWRGIRSGPAAEAHLLWQDYLTDLRALLHPYYGRLERSRQLLSCYGSLFADLQLELLEARQLAQDVLPLAGLEGKARELAAYARDISRSQGQLGRLLDQLEDGIALGESVLQQLEFFLDIELTTLGPTTASSRDSLELLGDWYLKPVFALGTDLAGVERWLGEVTDELHHLAKGELVMVGIAAAE